AAVGLVGGGCERIVALRREVDGVGLVVGVGRVDGGNEGGDVAVGDGEVSRQLAAFEGFEPEPVEWGADGGMAGARAHGSVPGEGVARGWIDRPNRIRGSTGD